MLTYVELLNQQNLELKCYYVNGHEVRVAWTNEQWTGGLSDIFSWEAL